jgi:hypothetical protein
MVTEMNQQENVAMTESSFPMGLVMVPVVLGALVWVCTLVTRMGAF